MNSPALPRALVPALATLLAGASLSIQAQTAPAPSPTEAAKPKAAAATTAPVATTEEAIQLSPFQVVGEDDRTYQAANTLGATRTNVAIRDLPMQINVVTEQLMVDRALFDLEQVLDVMPGTARTFNEFIPQVNIRGFDSSAAMRNGVRGLTTPDTNSIA
ncbi:MAG TPA: TonB-dependent receptor plug domain-containing protein, partial [Opitutaceae bacterium]